MEQYQNVVQDLAGNVIPQAVVRVLLPSGGNATVYDANGTQTANPVPCDAEGYFSFQATNGKYFAQVEVANRVYKKLGPITLYDPEGVKGESRSIESLIPEGATDHAPYFHAALQSGGSWRVGAGPFNFGANSSADFITGARLFCEGTVINHPTTTASTFRTMNSDYCGIQGSLTIVGSGKTVGAAVGIYRNGGRGILMEGINCKNISGRGFYEVNAAFVAPRGDRAVWSNCTAKDCYIGKEDVAAEDTEYNHWLNFNASGCVYPIITAAGNNRFLGGNVVDNDNGPWLKGATVGNNNHGGFVGMNINHNAGWNLRCTDVRNGESFTGCHFYGDSPTVGIIWLERSKGISIVGGIFDSSVKSDDAIGYSYIQETYCPDSGNAGARTGNSQKKVMFLRNTAPSGMWRGNDPGTCYVRTALAADQALTSGSNTPILYAGTAYDSRDSYNPSTGIFTLPWLGNFRVSGSVRITGTTVNPNPAVNGSYGIVYSNGSPFAFFPIVNYSAGGAVGSFSVDVGGAAGATIAVRVVAYGTGLSAASPDTTLAISEVV